jgi:hypothetical protein
MNQVCETPLGFLLHAQEFFYTAQLALNQRDDVSLPSYFLLGRSIELSLKAFLLSRGVTPKELKSRRFGHNLEVLFDEAIARNIEQELSISDVERGMLRLLNWDYLEKRFEYRVTGGTYALPLIDVTTQIARKLAYGLSNSCAPVRSSVLAEPVAPGDAPR